MTYTSPLFATELIFFTHRTIFYIDIFMQFQEKSRKISTYNEKPLHESLKSWYAQPGDRFEISVDGFVVDIVRGDLLIEIQTRNFAAIRRKLEKLVVNYPLRLVYPIPAEKWIIKIKNDLNHPISRRKSPKRGVYEYVFNELVHLPGLLMNSNFSIDLLLIQEEEVLRYDGKQGWRRRGWVTHERKLIRVVCQRALKTPADMLAFIPSTLAEPFTTSDLATTIGKPQRLAQKIVYFLRQMNCIQPVGKRANSILYNGLDA